MTYIYVVYCESTAENLLAFATYELAVAYVEAGNILGVDTSDYRVDKLELVTK